MSVVRGIGDLIFVDPQVTGTMLPSGADGPGFQRIAASDPAPWPAGEALVLDGVRCTAGDSSFGLDEFTEFTHGTSLLVLQEGRLRYEWYADGVGHDSALLGASMTKSALAHLVALAAGDGLLNLGDPVPVYVPELQGTGYERVTVAQLLSMTSGTAWLEDYRDPATPAVRLLAAFTGEGAELSRDLLCEIEPQDEPGTRYAYSTADSQVLDWVRERATGLVAQEAFARLWAGSGATRDAWLLCDAEGVALAGGGLAATAGDWLRIGALQLTGSLRGLSLPPGWPDRSSRPSAPFLQPGRLPETLTSLAGFGYHWWPLDDQGRQLTADGSRGQFCFIDRDRRVVVVKTSRWPYADAATDLARRDACYRMLPAIARAAAGEA